MSGATEQLIDQDDLKYHNYSILVFVKEFERVLQMIGEATFQLEESEKRFYELGDFSAKLETINDELKGDTDFGEVKAEVSFGSGKYLFSFIFKLSKVLLNFVC